MESFVTILHIIAAVIIIGLVLVQDTKSGSVGGAFGGGGSGSVFGATGAATLAQKMTRWTAILFAATSITLTVLSTQKNHSVIDSSVVPTPNSTSAAPAPSEPKK